jgi:hypothetical protein
MNRLPETLGFLAHVRGFFIIDNLFNRRLGRLSSGSLWLALTKRLALLTRVKLILNIWLGRPLSARIRVDRGEIFAFLILRYRTGAGRISSLLLAGSEVGSAIGSCISIVCLDGSFNLCESTLKD